MSTAEELSFPWLTHPEEAAEIDAVAKRVGKTVLATGVNPGFVMDSLPLNLTAIRLEASLSFLGVGVPPPTPTLGSMVRAGVDFLGMAPWVSVFAGLAILISIFGFNLLGDGLRDISDPKLYAR